MQNNPNVNFQMTKKVDMLVNPLFCTIVRAKMPGGYLHVNTLNPGQFTHRVYRLPRVIRDNVPVSVSVFWQGKFW